MDETSDIADIELSTATTLAAEAIALAALVSEHAQPLELSDDLPCAPAIRERELDAIERYMSDILDEVLALGSAIRNCTTEEQTS